MNKPVAQKAARYIDGEHYVPAYLSTLSNRLSSGASQLYLEHFGIGINEWRILSVLSNWPGSTVADICETVSMHKTVASRSLGGMDVRGLVAIDASERQRRLWLTRAGQELHDKVVRVALAREALLLHGFSATERATLVGLLARMVDNLPRVDGASLVSPRGSSVE